MTRRVVITGMGMVTPLGRGLDINWKKIVAGKSGISKITYFDTTDYSSKIAGQVPTGDAEGAFLIGKPGHEMSIMYGLVGCIPHPQIINDSVNYSKEAWAAQPTQMISYVSCHDDMCLADRIKSTLPADASMEEKVALHKLAETFVFTSQGVPFIFTGDEVMRDKKGVHNSYNSPDSINTIDWKQKTTYREVFDYIKDLIAMRKAHPAFRMGDADLVRQHVHFLPAKEGVVAWELNGEAVGDSWKRIVVILNGQERSAQVTLPEGVFRFACVDGECPYYGERIAEGNS